MTDSRHIFARRGFAGIMAITLLLLVASALAVLGMAFAADGRRTRTQADEARLRRLLTAGAVSAARQIQSGDVPAGDRVVDLPPELLELGAKLTVTLRRDERTIVAVIRAELQRRSMEQVVRFDGRGQLWAPADASLVAARERPVIAARP